MQITKKLIVGTALSLFVIAGAAAPVYADDNIITASVKSTAANEKDYTDSAMMLRSEDGKSAKIVMGREQQKYDTFNALVLSLTDAYDDCMYDEGTNAYFFYTKKYDKDLEQYVYYPELRVSQNKKTGKISITTYHECD